MINVPDRYKHEMQGDQPSEEYMVAEIRDLILASDGKPISSLNFTKAIDPNAKYASLIVRGLLSDLIASGRIIRKRTSSFGGGSAFFYTWVDKPMEMPVVLRPLKESSKDKNGPVETKILPGFKTPLETRMKAVRELVLRSDGQPVRWGQFMKVTGHKHPGSIDSLLKKLISMGHLKRKKFVAEGQRPGYIYTWHDNPKSPHPLTVPKELAPSIAADLIVTEPQKLSIDGGPSITRQELRDLFIDWLDDQDNQDYIIGASKFRQYIEAKGKK